MPPVINAATAPQPLSYDDLVCLPEDGLRHEVMDGTHVVSPAPTPGHQAVSRNLTRILSTFLLIHRLGKVFSAPIDVRLTTHNILEPDLVYIAAPREAMITPRNIEGAPDLVVEIFSPATRRRDESQKREIYRQAGVAEYWMADPDAQTLRVVRWSPDSEALLTAAETLTTPLLPGFSIPVADIFTA